MRLSRSTILIITCITYWRFTPSSVGAAEYKLAPEILKLASVSSTDTGNQFILSFGSTGGEVKGLQTKLKKLGYYHGVIDGLYGNSTLVGVSKFQEAKGLIADGIFGATTSERLEAVVKKKPQLLLATSSTLKPSPKQEGEQRGLVWWSLVGIGVLGIIGALLYLLQWYRKVKKVPNPETSNSETSNQNKTKQVTPSSQELDTKTDGLPNSTTPFPTQLLPLETTSRLAKVKIVDELINDLHSPDPTRRRKAIWDLGQQGDSRAIQPLVDLMMDADSLQRSLILAALAEVGIRTLKPMNRALAMSLQDESPQVRQNAIRDLTRVYDSMAQISQMLSHAVQDSDAEVQATARYALSQMNRIRALPTQETEEEREKESEEE